MGAADGVGAAVGAAVGAPLAAGLCAGAWVCAGVWVGAVEGLGVSILMGLESRTTPHTLQVLCSVPIFVVVASAATSQSVAI